MFIEVPPEYPTCRSVMAGINGSEIPHCLYSTLLPHPDMSISDFLSFELPMQFDSLFGIERINIQGFWSKALPMCINLENVQRLQKLPIPSSAVLDSFQQEFTRLPDQHEIKSIIYNHLPSSNPAVSTRFPLWVFNYWVQVSQLRTYARGPWNRAQHWAANQHLTRFPERRRLSNEIHEALGHVAWAGNVHGFSDPEPVTSLARYLSTDWLATTQINQQLDLLRWRIRRQHTPSGKHEIVATHFFPKIIQLFQQSHSTYTAESPPSDGRYPWAVGQNLADATSTTTIVSGVFNILDSHWVSMTVDVERRTISYGDSLVSDRKTKEVAMRAVEWWIGVHITGDFVCVDLPITRQTDSVSCGVFAVNSIQHLVFPQEGLLLTHEVVTERYRWFLGALSRHNELVSFFVLFCVLPLMRTPSDHPVIDKSQTPMRVYSPSKLCL